MAIYVNCVAERRPELDRDVLRTTTVRKNSKPPVMAFVDTIYAMGQTFHQAIPEELAAATQGMKACEILMNQNPQQGDKTDKVADLFLLLPKQD